MYERFAVVTSYNKHGYNCPRCAGGACFYGDYDSRGFSACTFYGVSRQLITRIGKMEHKNVEGLRKKRVGKIASKSISYHNNIDKGSYERRDRANDSAEEVDETSERRCRRIRRGKVCPVCHKL